MLLLEDQRFYVYIYLNPLKSGIFEYPIGKNKIIFLFEPFYVGKGKDNRLYNHLNRAKKIILQEIEVNKKQSNNYKLNIIKKILKNNLEPIIFKLQNNLNEKTAYGLEKFYINLIGRLDKGLGPLTNLTEGGEGTISLSKEAIIKRIKNYQQTLKNYPEILEKRKISNKITLKNHPEILEKRKITRKKTLDENPEIMIATRKRLKQTYKDNPEINIDKGKKIKKTFKDNPEIIKKSIEKRQQTYVDNPEIKKELKNGNKL